MTERSEPRAYAPRIGLVLPGGGARAAYQVGVLRALAELLPPRTPTPFRIISGTSAGAINATGLACNAARFRAAIASLDRVWREFRVDQVFRADTVSMMRSGLQFFLALVSGGWLLPPPRSVFDNEPLRLLLARHMNFPGIAASIDAGVLDALAVSASGYANARSVAFFETRAETDPWVRPRRAGRPAQISLDHLMASVAVPFLFPPVAMAGEFYGDGSMRQATPFSPAIHLGAERLLVIGTRDAPQGNGVLPTASPTFGQIFGYMLAALFMDGLYTDLERIQQINPLVAHCGSEPPLVDGRPLRQIDLFVMLPSRDIAALARQHAMALPRTLRVLLRTMGAFNRSGAQLMSYLMFEATYTREL
ncbi:MAG TPA: patatin-like phospholipase family protein, partial [Steroidobacteraceae bacterium]|nr:patatin-like phospholipase family protein [Steroidobacteraceae bacterium]